MNKKKALLALLILALILLFFALGLPSYFNLEYLQARRADLLAFIAQRPLAGATVYFLVYVAVTALSLPAAAVLTIAGGVLFGLGWGVVLAATASTVGATLAFLSARTVLRDWVRRRFGGRLAAIDRGMEKDGAFYLFSLRLVPLFPFVLINLAMALTPLRTLTFFLVSLVGTLPGTALYVNVGARLGEADSLPDILGPGILLSLLAVALFPWLARALLDAWRRRRALRGFARPRHYDANLVVIGAGAAGLVCAHIAALLKARVVLIEKQRMGGDCLTTGCVPSKALIRSAQVKRLLERAPEFGIEGASGVTDFAAVMDRVRATITAIAPHDSIERYTRLGVECVEGEARLASPFSVEVNGRVIAARAIVIATGSTPAVPPIPGLDACDYVTSDTVWNLRALPPRLLVLGAGPVGCELAQAFARLGSRVTLAEQAARLLPREDEDVAAAVARAMADEGIEILAGFRVARLLCDGQGKRAILQNEERTVEIAFDQVLLAAGRKPNLEGFGLKELGIVADPSGWLELDGFLRTRFPHILACGDVAGPFQFTHMASFQAWFASVNGLFGTFRRFRVDYSVVPWAVFTDPELARVGLGETEARERGLDFEVSRYGMHDLDRALIDGEARGFVKVLTARGGDRILGAVIVGAHASELIQSFVLAMTHGLGMKKLLDTIHIYPTFMEANRHAAAEWRRRHAPRWVFPLLERFHRWRRRE